MNRILGTLYVLLLAAQLSWPNTPAESKERRWIKPDRRSGARRFW